MEMLKKTLRLLIVINTLDKIYISTSSIPQSLADQVEKTLESCFGDRLNPVIISEDLADAFCKESIDFPVLVISNDFKAQTIKPFFNPRHPTYVLSMNSVKEFESTLRELATLPTWSVDSLFFVIRHSESDCDEDGREVLVLLQNMNQLTSFYICSKPGGSVDSMQTIYTLNSFSTRVPLHWQEIPHTRLIIQKDQSRENRSTLYKRPFDNDPKLCMSLKFEKTEHLDGYPVKAVMDSSLKPELISNKTLEIGDLRHSLPYSQSKYFETLFSRLNVTPVIYYKDIGNYTTDNVQDYLNTFVNGTYDVGLNYKYIAIPGYESVDIIDPSVENTLFILTHPDGSQKSIGNSLFIANLTNTTLTTICICVLVISYVIIVINKINNLNNASTTDDDDDDDDDDDPEYGNSFLDILKMIIGTGIMTPLNSRSMRIMFIFTSLLVFIVSPQLQAEVTSSSTKREFSYPTSIKDLFDLDYNVYIFNSSRKIFVDEKDKFNTDPKRLHAPTNARDLCYELILKDPMTSCVFYLRDQIEMADKHNLLLSLTHEFDTYRFLWSKKNWFLKKKVDSLTLQLCEVGFMEYWVKRDINNPLRKLRAKEASKPLSEYVPTEFDDLKLLYSWLASLALGLSVFVFLVEVLTVKMKMWRRRRLINEKRHRLEVILRKFNQDNVNNRFLLDKVKIVKGRVVILP